MKNVFLKWCNILSAVLIVCFFIKTVIDYSKYASTFNSAPFSLWVCVNAVYFILPAVIILVVGVVLRKKR